MNFDLLRMPFIGRALKWRYSRIALQIPVFLLAVIMLLHAFLGPQLAPKNLATLLTWVHFRGVVVLVLLLAGNFFCMACPFMLPRDLARRYWQPRWQWPRWARNKWPAIVLFVAVLFLYELFDLWGDPWWTGWMIVGYFGLAFVVDMLFKRASFCKYLCPIGQFNFLGSTFSPLEVTVRDSNICHTCRTKDCIRGVREPSPVDRPAGKQDERITQRGCELALFQPQKIGNLDCTFCLDCVYACPHDNVGILARIPGERLAVNARRSGMGVVEKRFDMTALIVVFTFGAVLNAFAMISPVYAVQSWLAGTLAISVEWPVLSMLFAVVLVLEPALLLGLAGMVSQAAGGRRQSLLSIINQFSKSLIPIGFGIWLAHYGFHFFTGLFTVIPVVQDAALHLFGTALLGVPDWQWGGIPQRMVYPLELGFLSLGLVGSWLVLWQVWVQQEAPAKAWVAMPWALLHLLLYITSIWILNQPMEMRGTFFAA